ncbi:MAG: ABC transporter permease, partial [Nonomuraea sp.]|nr:ABC transporter permease [Nonomuraea sp.]
MRRLLLAVPLLFALAGPWFVPGEVARGRAFSDAGLLGTDFIGRDTLHQV